MTSVYLINSFLLVLSLRPLIALMPNITAVAIIDYCLSTITNGMRFPAIEIFCVFRFSPFLKSWVSITMKGTFIVSRSGHDLLDVLELS